MEPTVHFAGGTRPRKPDAEDIGGVVPIRARSRSLGKTSFEAYKASLAADAEDEDAGLRNERDFKRKQVHKVPAGF